jgi:TRAP-type C4-dicarboxylate transport system permease large subunit
VAVLVVMVIGGISGSGPATSTAVGQVVTRAMVRDGYPRPFIASTVTAAAATDILIPPSIAFIVYAVLVPGVSVPAIFMAGMLPGILAGLAIIVAIAVLRDFGGKAPAGEGLSAWRTFREAFWGLMAPVVILGGMRSGAFSPWFGVVLTMEIAIGQFTPPLAVTLMVSCRIAGVTMESTVPWVVWTILAMSPALALVVVFPDIALWPPRAMGVG